MIFYFSWFIVNFLLLALKKEDSSKNVFIVFILFILVYGCRNFGGIDDPSYISAFNSIINGNENMVYGIEESFLMTARALGTFGFNFKAVFFIYALISFTFIFLAYKELCVNKYDWMIAILGFMVFSFLPTITVMRQFAACAILTYAFTLKLKNKNILSLIFIGLACLLHIGSLIGFVLFHLFSIKLNVKTKVIVPLVCLVIGYTGFFVKLLNQLIMFIPSKYLGYLDRYEYSNPNIGFLHTILIIIYLLQFVLNNKTNRNTDKTIDFLERGQMTYFSLYFITLTNGWMSRLSIYFILFLPFIFKTFISRFSLEANKQILYATCFAAFLLLFIYQIVNLPNSINMSNLIPYSGSFDFMD
ncbi:EpsG family protein [Desulfosporosinus fructosivorans]